MATIKDVKDENKKLLEEVKILRNQVKDLGTDSSELNDNALGVISTKEGIKLVSLKFDLDKKVAIVYDEKELRSDKQIAMYQAREEFFNLLVDSLKVGF